MGLVRIPLGLVVASACFAAALSGGALAQVKDTATETLDRKRTDYWTAPFGGRFNASFTIASEYSYAGISNTQLQPAYQVGFDYRSADLLEGPETWFYVQTWGSNVRFAGTGEGVEIDVAAGFKTRLLDRKLKLDLAFNNYFYPGSPVEFAYNYYEYHFQADYDFGLFTLSGRVRHSPNFFGGSGSSWTKRARLGVPLDFIPWPSGFAVQAYGTFGNLWVENFLLDGLSSQDYFYWQAGLVISTLGLDIHLAYTDTSISYQGCNYTAYCSGRIFASVTKSF